jgi:hypothetical protein
VLDHGDANMIELLLKDGIKSKDMHPSPYLEMTAPSPSAKPLLTSTFHTIGWSPASTGPRSSPSSFWPPTARTSRPT